MNTKDAATVLSALALDGRLAIFRLLIKHGPAGLAAGDIRKAVASAASTLSANLNILKAAGLVDAKPDGRFIYYSARCDRMRDLLTFLLEDCCNGSPEICIPLIDISSHAAAASTTEPN